MNEWNDADEFKVTKKYSAILTIIGNSVSYHKML